MIESLYIRALSRKPTPEEMDRLMVVVGQADNPQPAWKTSSGRC